jgi:hypothetical protein
LLIFRSEIDGIDDPIVRAVIGAIREKEARSNRGSRSQRIPLDNSRDRGFLGNGHFMIDDGRSREPVQYVLRDEFVREIGRIEGKFDAFNQVWRQQITDLLSELGDIKNELDTNNKTMSDGFIRLENAIQNFNIRNE